MEHRFAHILYGVHFGTTSEYRVQIREDGGPNPIPPLDLSSAVETTLAEVIELGTHSYPVTLFLRATDCTVRLDHTYSVSQFGSELSRGSR